MTNKKQVNQFVKWFKGMEEEHGSWFYGMTVKVDAIPLYHNKTYRVCISRHYFGAIELGRILPAWKTIAGPRSKWYITGCDTNGEVELVLYV